MSFSHVAEVYNTELLFTLLYIYIDLKDYDFKETKLENKGLAFVTEPSLE
jgi:hypothetical protein